MLNLLVTLWIRFFGGHWIRMSDDPLHSLEEWGFRPSLKGKISASECF